MLKDGILSYYSDEGEAKRQITMENNDICHLNTASTPTKDVSARATGWEYDFTTCLFNILPPTLCPFFVVFTAAL